MKLILLCNQALPGIEAWTAGNYARLRRVLTSVLNLNEVSTVSFRLRMIV